MNFKYFIIRFVELITKAFTIFYNMITDDKIAAARIAQIFGSELLSVDEKTTNRSGNSIRASRVDPGLILKGHPQSMLDPITHRANQEALTHHPSPSDATFSEITNQPSNYNFPVANAPVANAPVANAPVANVAPVGEIIWEKINSNLERIADRLETLDLVVRKRKIKPIQ